ncbi:Protein BatD [Candidatus Ornithobacterium hominis]|nr:Protein BatD [Candidatus Ornithobacterium hominis]
MVIDLKKYFYIVLIFGLQISLLQAQIRIEVQPSKKMVNVGDIVEINFTISAQQNFDLGHLEWPNVEKTRFLGNSKQTNFVNRNGETIFQKIETLVLRAEQEGNIYIPPVKVEINGKIYRSNELNIEVQKSKKINNPSQQNQSIFLAVELSNQSVYINQPVIATVKLYAFSYDALRRRTELKTPGLNDFQVKKISNYTQRDFNQETVGNRTYVSEEVGQFQLIAQKVGELIIPSFEVTLAIPVGFLDEKLVDVSSDPVKIKVKQLPENSPKNFTGAIGKFKINTFADKKFIKTNESLQFEIEVIGEGNLSMLQMPELNLSKDLEVYKPTRHQKFQSTTSGEKGKLVYTYLIVPQYGGEYTIPSISFSYFNLENQSYETINSEPIDLVVEGAAKPQMPKANEDEINKYSVNQINSEDLMNENSNAHAVEKDSILNIKIPEIRKEDLSKIQNNLKNYWYYWLIPSGVLMFAFLCFLLIKSKKIEKKEDKRAYIKEELKIFDTYVKDNNSEKSVQKAEAILNEISAYLAQEDKIQKIEVNQIFKGLKNKIDLYRYAGSTSSLKLAELKKDLHFLVMESLR